MDNSETEQGGRKLLSLQCTQLKVTRAVTSFFSMNDLKKKNLK